MGNKKLLLTLREEGERDAFELRCRGKFHDKFHMTKFITVLVMEAEVAAMGSDLRFKCLSLISRRLSTV